jgi:hypothetical protein
MIQFIARIRASDEKTKWKWLVIFTSLSTIIVITIWIIALRGIKADIEQVASPPPAVTVEEPSLLEKLQSVAREIGKRTSIAVQTIRSKIKGKSIVLTPEAATASSTSPTE